MEVAVKGKSPSYLHLFPHSSAGDRGGFSKPGGKLTSITLVLEYNDQQNMHMSIDESYIVVQSKFIYTNAS